MNLTRSIGQLASFLILGTLALPLLAKPAPVVKLAEQPLALQYNADNKLTQASRAGSGIGSGAATSESYGYDHEGRRVRKTSTDSNGNPQTTWYVYNGQDIVAEYEGNWAKPKAITTHGPNTDDPVVRYTRNSSNTGYDKRYYHQDGLGSSVAVTDEAGTVVATQLFDVWGNKQPNASLGQVERYGFTGREPDATGLIYYRARYYDPATARFTQRDPIGLQGGINQYAYVGNDPVNFTDPSGTTRQSPVGIVGDGYSGCSGASAELDPGVVTDFAEATEGVDLSKGEVRLAQACQRATGADQIPGGRGYTDSAAQQSTADWASNAVDILGKGLDIANQIALATPLGTGFAGGLRIVRETLHNSPSCVSKA